MPTTTITGDGTHEALQSVINQGINKYGRDFRVLISKNLRFEEHNQDIKKAITLAKEAVFEEIEALYKYDIIIGKDAQSIIEQINELKQKHTK